MADNTFRSDNVNDRLNDRLNDRVTATGSTTGDVVGETTGTLAGAATGAALGSLGGPIGTIIGGIAGAATGWWTGRAVSEAASTFDTDEDYYRNHFNTTLRPGSTTAASGSTLSTNYDTARPAYQLGHLAGMNPDYANRSFDDVETDLRRGYEALPADQRRDWNDVRDYARDAYARGRERRLTLAEEQLAVGKRQVQAGEVELRKTVETEHVQEQVGLMREEVTIERRPLTGADAANANLNIGEETVRVPLMAEEAIVEKRVVPVEEVVVHKQAVTQNQTVEADLRRERLVTEGLDEQTGYAAGTTDTTGVGNAARNAADTVADKTESLVDRTKDAARNLKDDVTGRDRRF